MWVALFAPAKTPQPVIDKLAAEIGKAAKDPLTQKRYHDIKVDPVGSTPAELDTFFRQQLKFNADVIKNANIQLD
jgi:tripartite-type tricarboxylate transporter receptor subunit TctC